MELRLLWMGQQRRVVKLRHLGVRKSMLGSISRGICTFSKEEQSLHLISERQTPANPRYRPHSMISLLWRCAEYAFTISNQYVSSLSTCMAYQKSTMSCFCRAVHWNRAATCPDLLLRRRILLLLPQPGNSLQLNWKRGSRVWEWGLFLMETNVAPSELISGRNYFFLQMI